MKKYPVVTILYTFIVFLLSLVAVSCGGSPSGGGFQTAAGTGYMFIGDAPPAGTTILKFNITLSSATLCPSVGTGGECTGIPQVPLLSEPVTIELAQLQLHSAFLKLTTVQAGNYAGVQLNFSNPELKFMRSDGTIQVLVDPRTTTVTPTFPSVVTVTDGANFGFLIDFNLRDSIQSNGSDVTAIVPVVTLLRKTFTSGQPVQELDETAGNVSSLNKTCASGSGSFNLTPSLTGLPVSGVQFDSTTVFDDSISCDTLGNGQTVEVDVELLSQDSSTAEFFAKRIELVNEPEEDGLEGTILQVNSTSQFVLLVDHSSGIAGFSGGAVITASFDPLEVQFGVESNDFTSLPTFASGADLLAGQKVELDVVSSVVGTNNCAAANDACTATVDRVKLKQSTFTASVGQTIVEPDFALVTLPSIFGTSFPLVTRRLSGDCQSCLTETVTVRTADVTEYENLPFGFSNLITGSNLTVRGLLFKDNFHGPGPTSDGFPLLVAKKIRMVTTAP